MVGLRDLPAALRPSSRTARLDAAGFAEAVRPHMPAMLRLAARLGPRDAFEDVVQDALVRAWRHRSSYDERRGTLAAWLMTIVANEARRAYARQRRPLAVVPFAALASEDGSIDLDVALGVLAPRQRLAVDCHYFAGPSIGETAAVMKCSEGTVKSTVFDARARLRDHLEGR